MISDSREGSKLKNPSKVDNVMNLNKWNNYKFLERSFKARSMLMQVNSPSQFANLTNAQNDRHVSKITNIMKWFLSDRNINPIKNSLHRL